MEFDFKTFKRLAVKEYSGGPYSLENVLGVFKCYFLGYEEFMRNPHPPIRSEQIRRIVQVMPYINQEDIGGYQATIEPEHYPYIIAQHFKTRYKSCDYNINHFFTGKIRALRFYEICY